MIRNEPTPSTSCTRVEIATPRIIIAAATTQNAIEYQNHSNSTPWLKNSVSCKKPPNASPIARVSAITPP